MSNDNCIFLCKFKSVIPIALKWLPDGQVISSSETCRYKLPKHNIDTFEMDDIGESVEPNELLSGYLKTYSGTYTFFGVVLSAYSKLVKNSLYPQRLLSAKLFTNVLDAIEFSEDGRLKAGVDKEKEFQTFVRGLPW